MKDFQEKLEMKVKDCYNTNTIFDTRKYILLSDAKKAVNEARRELLIDFCKYLEKEGGNGFVSPEFLADQFLKSK